MDWLMQGACRGRTDEFFPVAALERPLVTADYDRAKAICATCPVLTECRDWAVNYDRRLHDTVVGGLTPLEMRRARKGRRGSFESRTTAGSVRA